MTKFMNEDWLSIDCVIILGNTLIVYYRNGQVRKYSDRPKMCSRFDLWVPRYINIAKDCKLLTYRVKSSIPENALAMYASIAG